MSFSVTKISDACETDFTIQEWEMTKTLHKKNSLVNFILKTYSGLLKKQHGIIYYIHCQSQSEFMSQVS